MEPDGRQPLELARTLSWNYSNMNLLGFFTLARLCENIDIDLWTLDAGDGRSIRRAFEWLLPYIRNEKKWTYEQIEDREFKLTVNILRLAARQFRKPEFDALAKKLSPDVYQKTVEAMSF